MAQQNAPEVQVPNADPILLDPSVFFRALSIDFFDDLVFLTYDQNWRIVYLSDSAEENLNIRRDWWVGQHVEEVLSSNPRNHGFRTFDYSPSSEPHLQEGARGECEIVDRFGKRVLLKYWRVPLFRENDVIGAAVVFRVIEDLKPLTKGIALDIPIEELRERVASLSDVERQVVELVTAGLLNKSIAAKLNVAVRTVETRRSRMMLKLRVKSVPELVRFWLLVQEAGL